MVYSQLDLQRLHLEFIRCKGGVPVDFTVTPVLTGLTAKSWGFDRGQINTDDDNSDVLIDWPSFEVIPNGKTTTTRW